MAPSKRSSYDGVAVAVPITVPYVRYATEGAHWFIGRALDALVRGAGVAKEDIDGLSLSSFSLAPDTAVGVTQHLGLSPRWLDHVPTGGASGVMCLRRAARAVGRVRQLRFPQWQVAVQQPRSVRSRTRFPPRRCCPRRLLPPSVRPDASS